MHNVLLYGGGAAVGLLFSVIFIALNNLTQETSK